MSKIFKFSSKMTIWLILFFFAHIIKCASWDDFRNTIIRFQAPCAGRFASMWSVRRYMRLPHELKPSEIFKQDSLSPSKIALQIILLQIFYYTTACILFYCWAKLVGYEPQVEQWLFSWEYISYKTSLGISISLLWLLDSLICVIFLTVIVGRSKLAWDFAVTIHAINLIVVISFTREFPSVSWIFLQLMSSLILVFLSTWTTRWRELRDTFFEGLADPGIGSSDSYSVNIRSNKGSANEPIELRDLEAQK